MTKAKKVPVEKLRKSNMPCQKFRKFGRCSGKDDGTCIKVHNPNQVVLCTKFLQGACLNKNCLLSHKISPEKMPTCKYYLEGSCAREDCPYLHVKISPKADVCKDFLEGFCEKAAQCDKRHQFLCPDFEKNGACPRRRCPYPHGNLVRKFNITTKFAKKCSRTFIKKDKESENCETGNKDEILPSGSLIKNFETKSVVVRYYEEVKSPENKLNPDTLDSSQTENQQTKVYDFEVYVKNRPKLGQLPSYIPLFEEKS